MTEEERTNEIIEHLGGLNCDGAEERIKDMKARFKEILNKNEASDVTP